MCRGRALLKVWRCRGKSKKTTTQPRANPSVIVLHPAREGRGKGLQLLTDSSPPFRHDGQPQRWWGCAPPRAIPILAWLVEAVGGLATKHLRGNDGRTGYERLLGEAPREEEAEQPWDRRKQSPNSPRQLLAPAQAPEHCRWHCLSCHL